MTDQERWHREWDNEMRRMHGFPVVEVYDDVIDVAFTVSPDTGLRQCGVSADTVLAPSVGSPTVREANK